MKAPYELLYHSWVDKVVDRVLDVRPRFKPKVRHIQNNEHDKIFPGRLSLSRFIQNRL